MLDFPDEVREYLSSTRVESRTVAVASYQGVTREIPVTDAGSVVFDGSGEVQSDASITVAGFGDSLVPKSRTDLLAPNGQEVSLFREIAIGPNTYRLQLGVFRVTGWENGEEDVRLIGDPEVTDPADALTEVAPGIWAVPPGWVEFPSGEAWQETSPGSGRYVIPDGWVESAPGLYPVPAEWVQVPSGSGLFPLPDGLAVGLYPVPNGWVEDPPGSGLYIFATAADVYKSSRSVVLGWSVDVDLADRLRMLQRARLMDSKSPPPGATMYSELQRLLLFPLQQNPAIPDVAVPAGMLYESGLIGAVYALAGLAGAVPQMTREGVLTLRVKDAWAEPELTPVFDIDGTIDWRDGMTDDFENRVRVSDPDGKFVAWAVADDDSNPLSIDRAGPSDFEHVSPVYTSQAAAQAGADTILQRVLHRRSREVTVSCTAEALLLELGDVGWVRDPVQGRAVLGEVSKLTVQNDVTAPVQVSLIVAEAV